MRPPSYPSPAKISPLPSTCFLHLVILHPSNQHFLGFCSIQLQGTVGQRGLNPSLTPLIAMILGQVSDLSSETGTMMVGLWTTGCITVGRDWSTMVPWWSSPAKPVLKISVTCLSRTCILVLSAHFCFGKSFFFFFFFSIVLDSRVSSLNLLLLQGDPFIELTFQVTLRWKVGLSVVSNCQRIFDQILKCHIHQSHLVRSRKKCRCSLGIVGTTSALWVAGFLPWENGEANEVTDPFQRPSFSVSELLKLQY